MIRFNKIAAALLLSILVAICGFSQEVKLASELYPEHRLDPLRGEVYNKIYIQTKGNPFLFKEWLPGTLYLTNNDSVPGLELRFDTYSQAAIVYIKDLNRLILPDENLVMAFSIGNAGSKLYFKKVSHDLGVKKVHSGYFLQVLYEGSVSLYKLYLNDAIPLRAAEMPFIEEFVPKSDYYIYINGTYEIAHLKRSYLKNRFPEHKKEISRYARTNRLSLKDENDFATMISHIDRISKEKSQ